MTTITLTNRELAEINGGEIPNPQGIDQKLYEYFIQSFIDSSTWSPGDILTGNDSLGGFDV